MDTPKQEVSWLERSPPDIWALFVLYIAGEQLLRLKMTGATFLWKLLKSPTVVKSVKLGTDFISFKSLPRFLNEFPSLESLLIHSCGAQWSSNLGLKLESVPSGVKKIVLSGKWSESITTVFGSTSGTLNLSKHLPHLEALDLSVLNISDYSWMTYSPQSLTKLSIKHWNGTVELPSSLIDFEADDIELSRSSFVSKLPLSLESFVVKYRLDGLELVVPLLPSSTCKLNLGQRPKFSDGPSPNQNIFEQLPKSLTWLNVPGVYDFNSHPEYVSLLPSTLTELKIPPGIRSSAWSLLPPNLTSLSYFAPEYMCTASSEFIDETGIRHQVPTIPFDLFPRTIRTLELYTEYAELYFCGPPEVLNRSFFPPGLTKLIISKIQISPETAKLLPSSLTHLKIGNLCERVCQHLPDSITTLMSFEAVLSPNLFKFLPKFLTFLRLSHPTLTNWFDYRTGAGIGQVVSELPDHQNCLSKSFDWKGVSLPSTLTHFQILYCDELGDSFLLHQHLPNLLKLSLEHAKNFTDVLIPLLSPHLTTLSLDSSGEISGKSFKFLPRSLTELEISSSESIFDSEIQHLPRTLKRADLNRAKHLTDICIPDLPPHLEWLYLNSNSQITPSSVPNFPYPLRSSQHEQPAFFATWCIYNGEVYRNKSH